VFNFKKRLSPFGRGSHQPFPFSEAPTKTQRAGRLPTSAGSTETRRGRLTAFAALGVGHVPVLATGSKDVHRKSIRLGTGLFERILGLAESLAELFERVLKPICPHISVEQKYAIRSILR
jgi:hypothetical protein